MQRLTLVKSAAILLGACVFGASQRSDATTVSMHPFNCVLVDNGSPPKEIDGWHDNGNFANRTGGSRWAKCPVPFHDNAYHFKLYGSSTSMTCYLQVASAGGNPTLYSTTSHSGNEYYWYRQLTAGSYAAELQCYLPNNASIWYTVNY